MASNACSTAILLQACQQWCLQVTPLLSYCAQQYSNPCLQPVKHCSGIVIRLLMNAALHAVVNRGFWMGASYQSTDVFSAITHVPGCSMKLNQAILSMH